MKNFKVRIEQKFNFDKESIVYAGAVIRNQAGILYGTVRAISPYNARKELCALIGNKLSDTSYICVLYQLEGNLTAILPIVFNFSLDGSGVWRVAEELMSENQRMMKAFSFGGNVKFDIEYVNNIMVKATKIYEIKHSELARSYAVSNLLEISKTINEII